MTEKQIQEDMLRLLDESITNFFRQDLEQQEQVLNARIIQALTSWLDGLKARKQLNDYEITQGGPFRTLSWSMDHRGKISVVCQEVNTNRTYTARESELWWYYLRSKFCRNSRRLKRVAFKRMFTKNRRIDPIHMSIKPVVPVNYIGLTFKVHDHVINPDVSV